MAGIVSSHTPSMLPRRPGKTNGGRKGGNLKSREPSGAERCFPSVQGFQVSIASRRPVVTRAI